MAAQTTNQLLEVLGFLTDPQPQVRRIALASLLPYTSADKPERNLFSRDHYIEQLATMCADIELIAHDALSALINLTNSVTIVVRLAKIAGFIRGLVNMIIDEKALLADLATMLLSNMSKVDNVSIQLLSLKIPFTQSPSVAKSSSNTASKTDGPESEDILALDLLLEVFLRGEGKKFNPNANYDFLASVFANVSTIAPGRAFLLSTPSPELEPPLSKLISFTEHPSTIRRGGVASSIKNAAFDKKSHSRLVASTNEPANIPGSIDLLPQMLLPLCGPEEFEIDILDELPTELQLLPPDKKREADPAIRLILIETLLLLATTRVCREAMRERGVYQVIKVAHLAETVPKVTEPMVRLVNLLMRNEGPDTAIEEIEEPSSASTVSDTVIISADGKQVRPTRDVPATHTHTPKALKEQVSAEVGSEDEEEMLIEV